MYYKEITLDHLEELASLYVETFNSEPWNDEWTISTAKKRLQQMINTEDSYGLCAYEDGDLCGAILGCMEQFYNGIMFNVKEFWVKNGRRGQGLGTQIFAEFEKRLKEKQVEQMILFTSRGDFTEHFYHKQNMKTNPEMIFMEKRI
ncbi:MAG: GNAT family N-acetyltransferase [Lachnospiraceae bacterium]|nr:GNAT family N-acetyltransferase [Lachnospiraceae bacterium]